MSAVRTVAVSFTTAVDNVGLTAKVVAWVERMCNEAGLDLDAAGGYFDLSVLVTDDDVPVWGSEFDGAENNADANPDEHLT